MGEPEAHVGRCFCGSVEIAVTGAPVAMGFCHCASCREWSAAPMNGFALFAPAALAITKGASEVGSYSRTPNSLRKWCTRCGGHLYADHPPLGLVDVYAAMLPTLAFRPTLHVNYAEAVVRMRDGLPKMKDLPAEMGGSGVALSDEGHPITREISRTDGTRSPLPAGALDGLHGALRGSIIERGGAGYEEARSIWNAMVDRRPGMIVRCAGPSDVVRAVRFAREHGLSFAVRGGGHNIAGLAMVEDGLVIDLSAMRGVWVDPRARRARAQGGCLLADVDRETQAHGLAAVLGFVSQTGIGGLTVGGGFGYLTRKHGWTCDNVASMEVVTPGGELVRAAADENPDLFWALRGGGGNFGIVTSFEYVLHPVGPEIVGGAIAWRAEDATSVLGFVRDFVRATPRELTTVAVLRVAPPAPWLPKEIHGKPILAVFVCHSGDASAAEHALAPLRAFGSKVADTVMRRPYVQMQSLLDATQPKGRRYYWKSHYLPGLEARSCEVAIEHAARIVSPHSGVVLFQVDGALNELPDDHSPAGNRDAGFILNITASWERADDDARNIRWARDAFEATKELSTGGTYVNFLNAEDGADRVEAAYGKTTLARLASIKAQLDPENVFRHAKPIG